MDAVGMRHLAIDIGASSGKILLGCFDGGEIHTECVHRFPNKPIEKAGRLCWDIEALYKEVLVGMRKASPVDSVSIDTWGVDYVLLDKDHREVTPATSYRDKRTDNVACPIAQEELYKRTGTQKQRFNTIYQLLSEDRAVLDKAHDMLMIPDYLAWKLTGEMAQEYTNASTTNLLEAGRQEWDHGLIDALGLPGRIFKTLSMPGTRLGRLRGEVRDEVGYDTTFILAPSHDTAAAVLASPLGPASAYLSSGTWSLLGCLLPEAITNGEAAKANFTNEGADDGQVRFLKNIMGTWMLQNIRKEAGGDISFDDIVSEARSSEFIGLVDALDDRFLAPASMTMAIADALEEQGLRRPSGIGETARVVYESLAEAYKDAICGMEAITGRRFDHLAIVGGGSKDDYLNQLTAKATGLRVTAGPDEGSAIGNLLSAMLASKEFGRSDIKDILVSSFEIHECI